MSYDIKVICDWLRSHPQVSDEEAAAELFFHFRGRGWPGRTDEEAYKEALRVIERNRRSMREQATEAYRFNPDSGRPARLRPTGGRITSWRDNC